MNLKDLKEKIIKEVDHLDDEKTHQQVLQILNSNDKNESSLINAMEYKDKLFTKHDGLLKRLS